MPEHQVAGLAITVYRRRISFNISYCCQICRWMYYPFETRHMFIEWNASLIVLHGKKWVEAPMTPWPYFEPATTWRVVCQQADSTQVEWVAISVQTVRRDRLRFIPGQGGINTPHTLTKRRVNWTARPCGAP